LLETASIAYIPEMAGMPRREFFSEATVSGCVSLVDDNLISASLDGADRASSDIPECPGNQYTHALASNNE